MEHIAPEDVIDVAIVGAGPAGLAAANRCAAEGVSFVLIEEGSPLSGRSSDVEQELARGVGGAGLYSDGKLSFYPSAHSLWALPQERILREAYGWLQSLTIDLVGRFPPFPTVLDLDVAPPELPPSGLLRKDYVSLVLDPTSRTQLINRLVAPIAHRIWTTSRVISINLEAGRFTLMVATSEGNKTLRASRILLCLGRFSTRFLDHLDPRPNTVFRRFEYGIRIQQPASVFFLKDDPATDTKLLLVDDDTALEWRTFCCCRGGQIVETIVDGIRTCSGTSCDTKSMSNIGFNCRLLSAAAFAEVSGEAASLLSGTVEPFSVPFDAFLNNTMAGPLFGPRLDVLLRRGLSRLVDRFAMKGAVIVGPCLEGMGYYPQVSSRLETSTPGIYVAGDGTGIFRGLIPALMSGVYAGAQASRLHISEASQISAGAHIKRSPLGYSPLVFTAQSKKFFYCRDAVCEFVLDNGGLPLNPFRVFDYFLGDRVDRDLIRQGNNQLVRTCDQLWVFGPVADGVLFELFYAAHIGKPIKFFTIGTHASDIRPIEQLSDLSFEPEVHAPQQRRALLLGQLRRLLDNTTLPQRERTLFDI